MTTHKLIILFLLQKARLNRKGECPVRCRITYAKQRKEFATGYSLELDQWDGKKQIAIPPNSDTDFINQQLSLIKQEINQAFLFLQVQVKEFSADDIYLKYKGEFAIEMTVLEVFKQHNERVEKLIGKDYVKATYLKFRQSYELVKSYIKFQYKKGDIQFKQLNMKFILDYEFYLKTEKNLGQATVNKVIQRFRKTIKIGLSEGYIDRDPFMLYKSKKVKKEIVFLTAEELEHLESHEFLQVRLAQVKDMFVFCCYTGLAYNEMAHLNEKHISLGFDGNKWIKMIRAKTSREISIPLLPKAIEILDKYKLEVAKSTKILPIISNQKFNSYLKEIADVLGLEKNLTHHIARKTFATTVLLYNDVPMEIVSELLGHSKMSITQEHYGKVVQRKVSDHMLSLTKKLKG